MAMSRPDGLPLHEGAFDYARNDVSIFTGEADRVHVALATFNHRDTEFAFDRCQLTGAFRTGIVFPLLGTIVIAGPAPETIEVMVPDCFILPEGPNIRIDLRHVITLRLGSAVAMGHELPPPDLTLALCPDSLAPLLGLHSGAYWEEIKPLLKKWTKVNDTKCPECGQHICVNMSQHLRQMHTDYICFWRCPIPDCPCWFQSELNAKDHIKRIHRFQEVRGHSFYECLRGFGLEWFGSRKFFDQRKSATQSIWIDLAKSCAIRTPLPGVQNSRLSGVSSGLKQLQVKQLQLLFDELLVSSFRSLLPPTRSLVDTMRDTVESCDTSSSEDSLIRVSPVENQLVATPPVGSSLAVRQLTPVNRSLRFLESGSPGASQPHDIQSRLAVPDLCVASTRLLSHIDPFPLDRLLRHTARAVRAWPPADRDQILAVAHRDLQVTRQNIAELTLYVDDHATHLAACARAEDDSVPLMSAETFPLLAGGIQATFQNTD